MCGSNSAAVRYYMEAVSRSAKAALTSLTFDDILRLVEQGEPKAIEALHRMAHHLGAGLAMLMTSRS